MVIVKIVVCAHNILTEAAISYASKMALKVCYMSIFVFIESVNNTPIVSAT